MALVDDFLDSLKKRIVIPANQALLSDTDILRFADKAIRTEVVPLMVSMRGDYLVSAVDTPLIVGQAGYPITTRAAGRTLRDLKLRTDSNTIYNLSKVELEDEHLYRPLSDGLPRAYYLRGDTIVLLPTPGSALYVLEQWIQMRPSALTEAVNTARVISTTATTVTIDSNPPTAFATGILVDFVSQSESYAPLAIDQVLTGVSGTTLSFAAVPATLSTGDRVAVAGETPWVPFPEEITDYIESLTGRMILTTLGDQTGAQAMEREITEQIRGIKQLMEPRNRGEATKILPRRGILRGRSVLTSPWRRY